MPEGRDASEELSCVKRETHGVVARKPGSRDADIKEDLELFITAQSEKHHARCDAKPLLIRQSKRMLPIDCDMRRRMNKLVNLSTRRV
jgi:hypothetical protein